MPQEYSEQSTITNKADNLAEGLRLRLDNTAVLEQIELFLRGSRIVYERDKKNNSLVAKKVKIGNAKANDDGIQSLLNWISSTVNPQVVQGNFPVDDPKHGISNPYYDYLREFHIEFATYVMVNLYEWEISEKDYQGIISFVMMLIIPFMSRLIGNKERESYSESWKITESGPLREQSMRVN